MKEAKAFNKMDTPAKNKGVIFEDIFDLIGHIGTVQILMYIFACIIETSVSLSVMFYSLEYAIPGWTCAANANTTIFTTWMNGTGSTTTTADGFCPTAETPCVNLTYLDKFTSISTEWDLICDRRYLSRLTASLYFVGNLIGSCIGGQISDIFGRKRTTLFMWVALVVTQTCTGFAKKWEVYLSIRMLAGVCAGGCDTVAHILLLEYLGPAYRMLVSNRVGWQIGAMLVALLGFLTREWQKTAIGAGLMMVVFIPFYAIFMPESARWLIQRGRVKEAGQWIKRIAKYNRRPPPDLAILEKIAETEKAKRHLLEKYTYLDLFRTRKYAIRSSVLVLGWFDIALLAYGIGADMEALTGSIYLNITFGGLAMVSLRWTAIPLSNKIGRRRAYLFYKLGLLVCLIVIMVLAVVDHDAYGAVITSLVLGSHVFQGGVWALVVMYSSEAYPTLLRARSSALGNMSSRIGAIASPHIGLLAAYHKSAPYILYLAVSVVSLFLFYWVMPETSGKPLPEDLPPQPGKESAGQGPVSKRGSYGSVK